VSYGLWRRYRDGMFIRAKRSGDYEYLQLVESERVEGGSASGCCRSTAA